MNIILFDGVCNLCNNFVPFLIKYDKNNIFHFAAMQTKAGENIMQEYGVLNDRKSIILIKVSNSSVSSNPGINMSSLSLVHINLGSKCFDLFFLYFQ